MDEAEKESNQSSSNKAPGIDRIPAEIYRAVGPVMLETFHTLLINTWQKEDMLKNFRDATSVTLFKTKGSKGVCWNY